MPLFADAGSVWCGGGGAGISLVDAGSVVFLLAAITFFTLQVTNVVPPHRGAAARALPCGAHTGLARRCACTVCEHAQTRRFVRSVDARTLELSTYSVMLRGLPKDASPHEVKCCPAITLSVVGEQCTCVQRAPTAPP